MIKDLRPKISLVITDLDNTLYDWVSFYVPALYEMARVASEILGVEQDLLLDDLQAVHRKYENSEQPFALLEAACVQDQMASLSREELVDHLDPAFYAFNRVRKEELVLYDGVVETLNTIRISGAIIVAHTEARVPNSLFRVKTLGLDSVIEKLYAPKGQGPSHPSGLDPKYVELERRLVSLLPAEHRKPDPDVIQDICNDFGVAPERTLYVGDSLSRDIWMANQAKSHSAWAHYGTIFDAENWTKLVRVTHWTEQDVQREKLLKDRATTAKPDVELTTFEELLRYFQFGPKGPDQS